MLVSHKHKLIFLKTRKTAGTSVEMLLEAATGLGPNPPVERRVSEVTEAGLIGFRRIGGENAAKGEKKWPPHTNARRLRRHLGDEIWNAYLKVACVRNPFDRTISQYHWRKRNASPTDASVNLDNFTDFVRGKWDDDKSVVMIDGEFVPDFLVRYEHMKEDLSRLAELTGLPLDVSTLPETKILSKNRLGEIADYYSEETADIVRTKMSWAFKAGGYDEKLPQPDTQ